MPLALGLTRVVSIRVAFPDLTVATVDKELALVAPCDLPGRFSSVRLCAVNGPGPSIRGDLHAPTALARHDVYVALHGAEMPGIHEFQTRRIGPKHVSTMALAGTLPHPEPAGSSEVEMSVLWIVLIVLLVLLLFGGGWGYYRR